jgi:uncharacterized membrane protein
MAEKVGMTWLQHHRLRHYTATSLWIQPLLAMVAALGAVRILHWSESGMSQPGLDPGTAQVVLGTMASSMFTFIVFVSSALLVSVQLASSQLTPRIIAIVFKDPITRISLVVFVFTFTFALGVLVRIDASVPPLTAYVAGYGCLASLGVFLYLIDHVGKALRPSGALWSVARLGREVIEGVYPRRLTESGEPAAIPSGVRESTPIRIVPAPRDGAVLAFDIRGIVALAERADCLVEMVPQVGDCVAIGDPLFRVFGGGAAPSVDALSDSVAVGPERTIEQDPAFAFRIIVDIACKGLSPAINDPTTAVLALDHIHHLLRNVGGRRLDDGRACDADGRVRLVYPTPNWEDFVELAVTEIRQFGGRSIQVARRLRAMLESLAPTLPEERSALLRKELQLLERSAERSFAEPEDRALAAISDFQGVGGNHPIQRSGDPTGAIAPAARVD